MIKESKKTTSYKKRDFFELDPNGEWTKPVTYSPSFIEKTRKAIETLKNCPVPEELIKQMSARKNRGK